MAKVDIIIPIYNAEKYIETTIETILKQNYDDWNLILVDDCSTDKTSDICERFALSDARIKYYKLTKNGGPSVARNVGIDKSAAEYLSFVDSDDAIEANYLSRLVTTAEEYKADVVWCNYYEEAPNGVEKRMHNLPMILLDTKQAMSFFIEGRVGLGSMCNKLYRRTFIEEHACRLNPKRMHGEDWQFNMEVFRCGAKIIPISDILYHYIRQNGHSVVASYRSIDYDNYVRSMQLKSDIAIEFGLEYNEINVNNNFIYMVMALLCRLAKSDYRGGKKEEFFRITNDKFFCDLLKSDLYSIASLPLRYRVYFALIKCRLKLLTFYLMKLF